MRRGRIIPWSLLALGLAIPAGCASSGGGMLGNRTTVGTLRTSVAQLQNENDQYRERVTELELESRRLADQLTEEREANGELTARLDDARALLSRQGLIESPAVSELSDGRGAATTVPVDMSRPAPRKPPFAQVGGGLRAVPYPEETASSAPASAPSDEIPPPANLARPATGSDVASASDEGPAPLRWLPVDTGSAGR